MSTETTSRARRPYDVRGTVIYAGDHEHDVAVGEVYQNGQPHPEEIAKIWATADRIMFPALAKIRNAASAAANGQLYQTVEDLRDLLSSIALVASNALPVPTIGDTQGSTQPAQVFASGTAATLGHLDVNGESRFGTFIEMTTDECRGVAIGDLLGRRVSLVPTEDLAEAVLPTAPDPTSAPDLSELSKRLACAAYRVGFPSASTDDLERMWISLTDEGRAPWIAAAQEVPGQVEWLHPSLAPTKQGTPILLKVQLHDGSHIAEGHVTEEGRLWVPSIAYTRGDPNVLGVIPLAASSSSSLRANQDIVYPEEMTPALRDALGVMNFQTGPVAHALRAGGADIPRKCEEEQAHVLHWFVRLALRHGDGWRQEVGDELKRIADAAKSRASAEGGQG